MASPSNLMQAEMKGGVKAAALGSIIATSYALYTAFKFNKCTSEDKKDLYSGLLWYMFVSALLIGLLIFLRTIRKFKLSKTILLTSIMILSSTITWVAVKNKTDGEGCDKDFMKTRIIWWSLGINILLFLGGVAMIWKTSTPPSNLAA